MTKTGLSLTTGQAYYFSVKAVNGYSLESDAKNSDGVLVESGGIQDTTPPSPPSQVRDGTSATADSDATNSTTELSANWICVS